jgi:hypothetical protein
LKDQASLLRLLFYRLADDRPAGRRQGRPEIQLQDQRKITLRGANVDRVRNAIAKLVEAGILTFEVVNK